MNRTSYEVLSGFTLFALFVPLAFGVALAAGVVLVAVAFVAALPQLDWALGGSLDSVRLGFDPDLFRAFEPGTEPDVLAEAVQELLFGVPLALFASAWVQNIGFVVVAAGLLLCELPLRRRVVDAGARASGVFTDGLAMARAPARLVAIGAVAGLTVMWAPAVLVELISEYVVALDVRSAELIAAGFADATPLEIALGMATIGLLVPLGEELVFRGFLWRTFAKWTPGVVPLLVTTILFALMHGSPGHILGVAFLGFVAGWLRLHSGSVWPSVALHAVNNLIAVGILVGSGGDVDADPDLTTLAVLAVFGGAASLGLIGLTWRWRVTDRS